MSVIQNPEGKGEEDRALSEHSYWYTYSESANNLIK